MIYAIATVIVLILDQLLKSWVTANLALGTGSRVLVPHVLELVNVHNDGVAFGLFSNGTPPVMRWFLFALAIIFAAVIIYLLAKKIIRGAFRQWTAMMVVAGALGNAVDRVLYGYVVDMFALPFFRSFPIFNIADAFVSVGAILFCLHLILAKQGQAADEGLTAGDEAPGDETAGDETAPPKKPKKSKRPSPFAGIENLSRPDVTEMTGRMPSVASLRVAQELAAKGEEPERKIIRRDDAHSGDAQHEAKKRHHTQTRHLPGANLVTPVQTETLTAALGITPVSPEPEPISEPELAPEPAPVIPRETPEPEKEYSLEDIMDEFRD